MKKQPIKKIGAALVFILILCFLAACGTTDSAAPQDSSSSSSPSSPFGPSDEEREITAGTETYRGFLLDNVYHSPDNGDIHFHIDIPEGYDGKKAYALYCTLPGYEGLYRFGAGANLRAEAFAFEARRYNDRMIIVAPQLNDWGPASADQTVALA